MYNNLIHLKSTERVAYSHIKDLISDNVKIDFYKVDDIILLNTVCTEYEGKSIFTIDNRKTNNFYQNITVQGLLKDNKKLIMLQDYGDDGGYELSSLS